MNMVINERIKELIEDNDLTYFKMEREIGISRSTISRWCRCDTLPNAEHIQILCEHYNVTPNWLLGWDKKRR